LDKKPLTLAEVKSLIFERWARNQAALTPDQRRLFEYLAKFTKVKDPEAARRAVEVLVESYGLEEEDAIQLVNVLPKTPDELRPFLFRSYPLLDDKAYSGILETLKGLVEEEEAAEVEEAAEGATSEGGEPEEPDEESS